MQNNIQLGQRVKFNPVRDARTSIKFGPAKPVKGTIVYINRRHHWFLVEYNESEKIHTSFHFCEIGDKVKLIRTLPVRKAKEKK